MSGYRFQRKLVKVEDAQQAVLHHVRLQEPEEVPLEESFGRRLAEPVCSSHPVPHFRRSGVDGYAIHAEDSHLASPDHAVTLEVTETIPCGVIPAMQVERGQAARIMTGAVVPAAANAVIMLEMTEASAREVCIRKRMDKGENITPIGHEMQENELLLQSGRLIGPGEAALLATFGYERVRVFRKPRVAIFSTGSELLEVGRPLENGKIRNSNSYMLACQVQEAGGIPLIMPVLPDEPEYVEAALLNIMEQVDFIITTGGVSVGDKDVLVDLFERWDGRLLFNKVAMRPGSPTSVGIWRNKLLFALSGNPGASYVGFELFVRPYMRALLGYSAMIHKEISGCLQTDYSKGSAYPRYVRGKVSINDGKVFVKPAGKDKSSVMVSIKDADCLICIPAGGRGAAEGESVRVILLKEPEH
ncbi:molybdopterin molybdenumtransferase MoeA [Paenibacillus sp. LMG 31456]|uniref:Molybdopterin molybdenumtransferase n=1 Tax=Paenibacillus foliorum TaxID=2654974 RepID=A0A972GNE1_9BACL|nr:gephyrin-like molybdotransferase Glp [Paenibacillus foliorum]NOU93889.1 molybdopterin molybdenumtransferase MoeA [Paenibacillus foliorum]